jgi:hypothetical protein
MITILISLIIGFIIGVAREKVLNKNYSRIQVEAYLYEMASYVSKKELRDNYETDYNAWERKVYYFRDYLLNYAEKHKKQK